MSEQEFIDLLKKKAGDAGSGRALSRELGVSAAYLSDVMRGRRDPGPKILDPLGYERKVIIEKTVSNKRRTK